MKAFTLAAGALTALSLLAGGTTAANAAPAPSAPKTTTVDLTTGTGATTGFKQASYGFYQGGTALVSTTTGATWSTNVTSGSTVTLYGTVFTGGARVQVLVDGKQVSWADTYRAQNPANPYQKAIASTTVPADGKTHTVTYRSLTTNSSRSVLALDFITVTGGTAQAPAPKPTPKPAPAPVPTPAPKVTNPPVSGDFAGWTAQDVALFQDLNTKRVAKGLPALKPAPACLTQYAIARSAAYAKTGLTNGKDLSWYKSYARPTEACIGAGAYAAIGATFPVSEMSNGFQMPAWPTLFQDLTMASYVPSLTVGVSNGYYTLVAIQRF